MAEYSLGTAKGRVVIDYDDKGLKIAADDFERVERRARSAGQGFDEAGNRMAVAGAVIAAGLGLAANSAINFEKQVSAIGAVSGATREELELLRKKALQIGKDTAFGATEAAMAMEELAKSGISVTDILSGAADATVALAAAGGVELPMAAELAADAMNSFELSAKDMPKIADLISGAANSSSISVNDFAISLKQVGAVANLVGLDFNDTATAIALMGKVGIKGSDAGTSLKTMFLNLQPVTKQQIELFKQLGIVTQDGSNKFFDQQGNIKSLAEVSQVLQDATRNMTAQQRSLALETIFGSDAIRAAATLTDAGAAGFDNMAAAMSKVTAQEVAAARLDNTAGAIERLKGSAETAAISFGTLLLPAIERVAGILERAADFFNGLSDSTKNTIVNVALATAGLLLFLGLAVKIFQFAQAVKTMVVALRLVTVATQLWSVATKAAALVWRLLNLAFVASPIGLIVLAIIALVAGIILLWKHSETFRKIVLTVWEAIKKAALAVVNWFKDKAVPFFQAAWKVIQGHFEIAKRVIQIVLAGIIGYFKFWFSIFKAIFNAVAPIVKSVFGLIVSIIKAAWSIISAILSVIVTVVKFVFGLWWEIVSTVFKGILALVKAVWGFIGPYIISSIQFWWDFVKGVWNWLMTATRAVFDFVMGIVKAVWGFIGPYIIGAAKEIWEFLKKAWEGISSTTTTVWNAIWEFLVGVWDALVALFISVRDKIVAAIDGIKIIVDKIRNFFTQLKAAADQGVGPLIAFVGQIPGKIFDAIGDLASLLYNKGRDIVQGLIDGIMAMINKLRSAAKTLVDTVGRFLPGSPAEEGPLSGKGYVLKRGRRMVDDFAAGILGAAKLAQNAMRMTIGGIATELPSGTATAVTAAQNTIAPINVSVPRAEQLAAEANRTSTVTIQNLNITGVWDLSKPEVPKEIVKKLHEQLDRYEKEHA